MPDTSKSRNYETPSEFTEEHIDIDDPDAPPPGGGDQRSPYARRPHRMNDMGRSFNFEQPTEFEEEHIDIDDPDAPPPGGGDQRSPYGRVPHKSAAKFVAPPPKPKPKVRLIKDSRADLPAPGAAAMSGPPNPELQAALNQPRSGVEGALNGQMPQAAQPQTRDQGNFMGDSKNFMTVLGALAGLAGVANRRNAISAMNAFGSAMQGYRQAQVDQGQKHYHDWEKSTKALLTQNQAALNKYNAVLKDNSMSVDEKLANIKVLAAQFQDQITYDRAAIGDMQGLDVALRQRQHLGVMLNDSAKKIAGHHDRLTQQLKSVQQRNGAQPKKPKPEKEGALPRIDLFDAGAADRPSPGAAMMSGEGYAVSPDATPEGESFLERRNPLQRGPHLAPGEPAPMPYNMRYGPGARTPRGDAEPTDDEGPNFEERSDFSRFPHFSR